MGNRVVTVVHLLPCEHHGRTKTLDEGSLAVQISHRYVVGFCSMRLVLRGHMCFVLWEHVEWQGILAGTGAAMRFFQVA